MLNVNKYDVTNSYMDYKNPLSVGNGDLCLTVDITGLQTFFKDYTFIPLTFMSNLLWHGERAEEKQLKLTSFNYFGKTKKYMYDSSGQAELFENLRMYPHKFNFCHFVFYLNNKIIDKSQISDVNQRLDILNGVIYSSFKYLGVDVSVITSINPNNNQVNFSIKSELQLQFSVIFSYPSPNKFGYSCDRNDVNVELTDNKILFSVDKTTYTLFFKTSQKACSLNNTVLFDVNKQFDISLYFDCYQTFHSDTSFWEKLDVNFIGDEQLDQRMVLSAYVLKINCSGKYPPQETGLTFNSWYSKFHLEMHPWHMLWSVWYGVEYLYLNSIDYYRSITKVSQDRAQFNGYSGLRFPKMTDPSGQDSPSNIGCLLLWQQPHYVYMLDEIYKKTKDISLIQQNYDIIKQVIDFLQSFLVYDGKEYHLDRPLISAQENHPLEDVVDPLFEVEYIRYIFEVTRKLERELDIYDGRLDKYIEKLVQPKIAEGLYCAHHNTDKSYTEYNHDHPINVGIYSFFKSNNVDTAVMKNTLQKIVECWDFDSAWGWDFPMMAMCALYLDEVELAIELLKMDRPKNTYLKNGHNMQGDRDDLTIYLPGNGAFMLAYKMLSEKYEKMQNNS